MGSVSAKVGAGFEASEVLKDFVSSTTDITHKKTRKSKYDKTQGSAPETRTTSASRPFLGKPKEPAVSRGSPVTESDSTSSGVGLICTVHTSDATLARVPVNDGLLRAP